MTVTAKGGSTHGTANRESPANGSTGIPLSDQREIREVRHVHELREGGLHWTVPRSPGLTLYLGAHPVQMCMGRAIGFPDIEGVREIFRKEGIGKGKEALKEKGKLNTQRGRGVCHEIAG